MKTLNKEITLITGLFVFSVAIAGATSAKEIDSDPDSIHNSVDNRPTANKPHRSVSDFVIDVQTGLPHRFPEGKIKGLWLSTVPLKLPVFVFPKGFDYKGSVVEKWVKNKKQGRYYLGKTPLLANLKNGTYEIVFVHAGPDYRDTGGVWCPFIAPKKCTLYADEGDYYWKQMIEVTVKDDFNTSIVLFQRTDQKTSDVLRGLPVEDSFSFGSADVLRDLGKLGFLDKKRAFNLSLVEPSISQAEEMLKRAGIWAREFDSKNTIIVEVKPKNIDVFTLTCVMSAGELSRFLKEGVEASYLTDEEVSQAKEMLKRTGKWGKKFHNGQTITIKTIKVESKNKYVNRYEVTLTSFICKGNLTGFPKKKASIRPTRGPVANPARKSTESPTVMSFHEAVSENGIIQVKSLFDKGADVNAKESKNIEPSDKGIGDMIHELIEDKTIS